MLGTEQKLVRLIIFWLLPKLKIFSLEGMNVNIDFLREKKSKFDHFCNMRGCHLGSRTLSISRNVEAVIFKPTKILEKNAALYIEVLSCDVHEYLTHLHLAMLFSLSNF
jgi:hypothetical protein